MDPEDTKAMMKMENGTEFPMHDFAVVPDETKPSTWKLRLTEEPGNITKAQLGRAAAALSPGGFRGNPVELTPAERAAAIKRIKAEYVKMGVEMADMPEAMKAVDPPIAPDDSTDPGDTKAGKRVMGKVKDKMAQMMSMMQDLMKWANYQDGEDMPSPEDMAAKALDFDLATGFKVYRDKAGKLRWLARSASAFRDREGEIFKTKALADYVERADKGLDRGPLMFWHVPGTEIGTCDFQAVAGRFLLESGTFDNTPQAVKAAAYLTDHSDTPFEVSIGYQFKQADRADGCYDWLNVKERSICPPNAAMNPWTQFKTQKEVDDVSLNKIKQAFLEGVFGTDFAAALVNKAEEDSKALESAVAFKADDGEPTEAFGVKELTETLAEAIKPLVEAQKTATATFGEVGTAMSELATRVKALEDKAVAIETEQAAMAEKAANAPRSAFSFAYRRPSDTAPTVTAEEAKANGATEPEGRANPNHPLNRSIGGSR